MNSISKRTAGELINRVSSDAAKLEDFITANGKDAIVKILSLVIIGILLFIMDWRLALMTVLPVPIVFIIVQKLLTPWRYATQRYGKTAFLTEKLCMIF